MKYIKQFNKYVAIIFIITSIIKMIGKGSITTIFNKQSILESLGISIAISLLLILLGAIISFLRKQ